MNDKIYLNNTDKSNENIILDTIAVEKIINGINKICRPVQYTIGPEGKNIIIEDKNSEIKIVRDGVTVAKHIELKDRFENTVASVVKNAIIKTNEEAGDGTSATTVITGELVLQSLKMISAGWSRMKIVESLNKSIKLMHEILNKIKIEINNHQDLINVATVSSSSEYIGKVIADAYKKVGKDGIVTVDDSNSGEIFLDFTEGISFESGFISRFLVTDTIKQICELSNAYIILIAEKESELNIKDLAPLLEKLIEERKDFIIFVEEIREELINSLVINKINPMGALKEIRFTVVKVPGFGEAKFAELEDISILTGAKIISKTRGIPINKINIEMFGKASKVIVDKNKTIIICKQENSNNIEKYKNNLKEILHQTNNSYDREELQKRIARLSGGVAIIKVGASTELEAKELKERIKDALSSTRSALHFGIVPGGGITYLKIANEIKKNNDFIFSQVKEILINSLESPIRSILLNAGKNVDYIIEKIKEYITDDKFIGYDVIKNEYVNMIECGIIDSARVVYCAIKNSISVACLLLNSNGIINLQNKNSFDMEDQNY